MASLPSLAELADVEVRLGYEITDTAQQARVNALLGDASVVVRAYCRRDFTAGTTTARYRPRGHKVILPNRPVLRVTAVRSVVSFGTSEQLTALSYWSHPGGHEVHLGDQTQVINGPTLDFTDDNVWVEVTYEHGFPEVPDDVVTVVANLVVRNLTVPGGGLVDLQTVGPYTTRFGSFTGAGPLALTGGDRDVLNRYRSTSAGTVELRG